MARSGKPPTGVAKRAEPTSNRPAAKKVPVALGTSNGSGYLWYRMPPTMAGPEQTHVSWDHIHSTAHQPQGSIFLGFPMSTRPHSKNWQAARVPTCALLPPSLQRELKPNSCQGNSLVSYLRPFSSPVKPVAVQLARPSGLCAAKVCANPRSANPIDSGITH